MTSTEVKWSRERGQVRGQEWSFNIGQSGEVAREDDTEQTPEDSEDTSSCRGNSFLDIQQPQTAAGAKTGVSQMGFACFL